jgi:hypothetical protein
VAIQATNSCHLIAIIDKVQTLNSKIISRNLKIRKYYINFFHSIGHTQYCKFSLISIYLHLNIETSQINRLT